jgi:hypothetical protein
LFCIGWGGLAIVIYFMPPTVWPRWLFFFLGVLALTGTALPVMAYINRRFPSNPPVTPSVIVREAIFFGIYFPIMTFVLSGFEHSVANMYFLPIGLMVEGRFITDFLRIFNNLIPVTIGNIIGGLLIVLLHPKVEEKIGRIIFRRQ